MLQNDFIPKLRNFWHEKKHSRLGRMLLPLALLYSRIMDLRRALRRRVWTLSGAVKNAPFSIIFAGGEKNKFYLADMIFGKGRWTEDYIGHLWLWTVYSILRRFRWKFELGIIEVNRKFARFFRRSFFVPLWTGGILDLTDEKRNQLSRKKRDIRKIKRYGFTAEITTEPARFEDFHKNMYLPFVKVSHGQHAFCATWEDINSAMKESELLLLKWEGTYIAGAIIHYKNGLAHLWINGLAEGNMEYLKVGAIGALDHFAEKRILEKGYSHMHYGGSRPFLKDGVLNYKKDRGLILRDSVPKGFLLTPFNNSAMSFFLENPFIHIKDEKLTGAVFRMGGNLDSDSLREIYREFFIKGMARLDIFIIDGILPEVPVELSKKIAVQPYSF